MRLVFNDWLIGLALAGALAVGAGCGGAAGRLAPGVAIQPAGQAGVQSAAAGWAGLLPRPSALQSLAAGGSSASRQASLTDEPLFKTANATFPILPQQHAANQPGDQLRFTPDYTPGGPFAGVACAGYAFDFASYSGALELQLDWFAAPSAGQAYLGLANFARDCWEWRVIDPAVTKYGYSNRADYLATDSALYAMLIITGSTAAELRSLRAGNVVPVATFTQSAASGFPGLTVSFNATGSADPDGAIVKYEWDPEGDGTYRFNFFDPDGSPTATVVYSAPGEYSPTVRVTDNAGAQATYSKTLSVKFGAAVAKALDGQGSQPDPTSVQLTVADGMPLITYISNWSLRFTRATNSALTVWTAPASIGGASAWELASALIDGRPAVAYRSEVGNVCYVRAANASGSAWNASSIAFVPGSYSIGFNISLSDLEGRPMIAFGDDREGFGGAIQASWGTTPDGAGWGALTRLDTDINPNGGSSLTVSGGDLFCVFNAASGLNSVNVQVARFSPSTPAWDAPLLLADTGNPIAGQAALIDANGRPMLVYFSAADLALLARRSKDASGTDWWEPAVAVTTGEATHSAYAAAIVNGLPCIACHVVDKGICLVYATSYLGTAWNEPLVLVPDASGSMYALASLPDGRPALAYKDITGELVFATVQP